MQTLHLNGIITVSRSEAEIEPHQSRNWSLNLLNYHLTFASTFGAFSRHYHPQSLTQSAAGEEPRVPLRHCYTRSVMRALVSGAAVLGGVFMYDKEGKTFCPRACLSLSPLQSLDPSAVKVAAVQPHPRVVGPLHRRAPPQSLFCDTGRQSQGVCVCACRLAKVDDLTVAAAV